MAKNDEGRTFPLTQKLRRVLEEQKVRTEVLQRRTGQIIPYVFHRRGQPIKDFRGAWKSALKAAGLPGRIPHDFRRTAVRDMAKEMSERVAMILSGHKPRSVFERYNIVNEKDLQEAAERLDQADHRQGATGTFTGTVSG